MPKKILLADDSITIQKVVELTFSDGDYEVIATSNGTKAIEEIPKVRPDIILSDIIMPEKNGYEVCEWVKSNPEYRRIPVILLTGTFEPFDPDRAEKAGCDAVVTKPFESQSLIQKVEELIGRRAATDTEAPATEQHPIIEDEPLSESEDQPSAEAVPPPPRFDETPAESPSFEEPAEQPVQPPSFELGEPSAEESAPFEGAESTAAPQQAAESTPFPPEEEEPKPQGDVFASEVSSAPAEEMEDSATRIIPKLSMEEIQRLQQQQQEQSEPAPAEDEIPPPPSHPPAEQPAAQAAPESSPLDAPEEELEDSATRIIPKMTMEEIQRLQQQQQAESQPEPQEAEEESAPFGGEEERESAPFGSEEEAEAPPLEMGAPSTSSEEEEDAATRMVPKMAFADLPGIDEQETEPEGSAEEETPEPVGTSGFVPGAPGAPEEAGATNPFETEAEAEPEAPQPSMEEAAPFSEPPAEQVPAPPLPPEEPASTGFEEPAPEPAAAAPAGELSDAQLDAIARRVVEMMSEKVIRDIAWEVIPETAEMIVRERIRQLEGDED